MRRGINNAMRNKLVTEYLNELTTKKEQQSKTKENENNSN
jgi:hypothetical protein